MYTLSQTQSYRERANGSVRSLCPLLIPTTLPSLPYRCKSKFTFIYLFFLESQTRLQKSQLLIPSILFRWGSKHISRHVSKSQNILLCYSLVISDKSPGVHQSHNPYYLILFWSLLTLNLYCHVYRQTKQALLCRSP